MVFAVTTEDVMMTLHILAVVVAFGGAAAYPLWFTMVRRGSPEQRAFFHQAQARLGKLLIIPGMLVLLLTGVYLTSDFDLWGEAWVLIPLVLLIVIAVLGIGILGPSEERLSRYAAGNDVQNYDASFRRVKIVTWVALALVIAATYMMVAHVPS